MLVSVALCTYNGEQFIEEQVASILGQSYTDLELVVCDDASTDGTLALLDKYRQDSRLTILVNETNLGPYKSFEKAIRHCRGEYIALADQDDVWKKEKIGRLVNAKAGELLLYSDSELITEDGQPMGKKISDLRNLYTGRDTKGFVFSNCVWGHAIFFHKDLKEKILPFPEGIPHDIWIGFAAACVSGIRHVPEALVYYRQHSKTYTSTLPPEQIAKRSLDKKAQEYLDSLHWIAMMRDYAYNEQRAFYKELHQLYNLRSRGKFSFPLFRFLLKHRKELFRFTKKSFLSQVNEVRKQARGVIVEQ